MPKTFRTKTLGVDFTCRSLSFISDCFRLLSTFVTHDDDDDDNPISVCAWRLRFCIWKQFIIAVFYFQIFIFWRKFKTEIMSESKGRRLPTEDLSNVEFETSEDVEVVPTFDNMGLRDELLRGIYAYGNIFSLNKK